MDLLLPGYAITLLFVIHLLLWAASVVCIYHSNIDLHRMLFLIILSFLFPLIASSVIIIVLKWKSVRRRSYPACIDQDGEADSEGQPDKE